MAGEPRGNGARVFHVVVREKAGRSKDHGQDDRQQGQANDGGKKTFLQTNAQTTAPSECIAILSQQFPVTNGAPTKVAVKRLAPSKISPTKVPPTSSRQQGRMQNKGAFNRMQKEDTACARAGTRRARRCR